MLRCIAIDDEELALELLEDNIKKVSYLHLVAAYNNPLEAMNALQAGGIDLVFLDIQMPGLTGLQFIKAVPQPCLFILITAYEKYALEGFNLNVVDYLVKPVELSRFMQACYKAKELYELRTQRKGSEEAPDYFFVNVDYSLLKVMKSDILWIEGLKDYIKIHLRSSSKPIVTRMSLKAIEESLVPAPFIRIHKSYIVSVASITSVRKNSVFVGTTELPVSDNYRDVISALTGKIG